MKKLFAALVVLFAVADASAAPIDYSVNRTIGAGSVTGTIRTDGNFGTLTQAEILGWTLLLNDGAGMFTLFGPLSGNNSGVLLSGAGVSATASALTFNYGAGGFLLFQAPTTGSGMTFWCQEVSGCTGTSTGETVDVHSPFPGIHVARSGSVVFATAGVTAVPEPETLGLLGLGIAALALSRRRKLA